MVRLYLITDHRGVSSSQPVVYNTFWEVTLIANAQLQYNGLSPSLASPGRCGFCPSSEKDRVEPILAQIHNAFTLGKRGCRGIVRHF